MALARPRLCRRLADCPARSTERLCVLWLLCERRRREALCQRVASGLDARGDAHGVVDAERLPGPARELCDGRAGARRPPEGEREDAPARALRAHRQARCAAARRVLGAGSVQAGLSVEAQRRRIARPSVASEAERGQRRQRSRRHDRGAVHGRRVRGRRARREGLVRPRHVAPSRGRSPVARSRTGRV